MDLNDAITEQNYPEIRKRKRILIVVGLMALSWALLFTWLISRAAPALAMQPADSKAGNPRNGEMFPRQEVTATLTATITPTLTLTPTSVLTPTLTHTPTVTTTVITGTATPTPTPTVSGTPHTATPTVTGTPPTPTPTGTVTPAPALTNSVSPTSANINGTLTFTLKVTNSGSAAAANVIVSDSFPTTLDITNATTTRGTAATNSSSRTVTVTVGSVSPGETVTITITTRVNSNATSTVSQSNTASMTYSFSGVTSSRTSNTVTFQVVGSSTLPSTGWGPPLAPVVPPRAPIPWLSLFFGFLALLAMGAALLLKTLRKERVLFFGIGIWLVLIALVLSPLATGWLHPPVEVAQAPAAQDSRPSQMNLPDAESLQIIFPTQEALATLPNYPIPTPEFTPTPGENGEQADSSAIERILIPALGIDTVVKYVPYDGATWKIAGLRQEVAWMGDTSWPGLGGNTALAGHITLRDGSNGPFRYLEDIMAGDEITLFTERGIYHYQVSEERVVGMTDLSVVQPTGKKQLTLITCTGWDASLKVYAERLAVQADLVSVEPRSTVAHGN